MKQEKGLFERQPSRDMGGQVSNPLPQREIEQVLLLLLLLLFYNHRGWDYINIDEKGEEAGLLMRKDGTCALSKCIWNIHLMFTLGWRLNIRTRKISAPDIRIFSPWYLRTWKSYEHAPKAGVNCMTMGKEDKAFLIRGWNLTVDLDSRILQR